MTDETEIESQRVEVEKIVDISADWREDDRATIEFFINSACSIGRDSGRIWLEEQEKRALYEALEDYYDD